MAIELPELLLPGAAAWRSWLAEHHADSSGVRLVLHKKGGAVTGLTFPAALDEALCFGWIDGTLSKRDEESYLVRFTPRAPRSAWSAKNVGHVERLIAAGRMAEPGLAAVETAKADGRWAAAYEGQGSAELPEDLRTAIAADAQAQAMFEVLTRANRYALIYRTTTAKTAATRARRIADLVEKLACGETPHPQKAQHPRKAAPE